MEEDLPKSIAFTDPINIVFDLNEEMLSRVARFRYILIYTFWAGIAVSILAIIAFILLVLFEPFSYVHPMPIGVLIASLLASYLSRQQRPFLEEYRVLASAVKRAGDWDPHPKIPDDPYPTSRMLKFLEGQDERYAYLYKKKPKRLQKPAQIKGKSKKIHTFDAIFCGISTGWPSPIPEGVTIFIRSLTEIRIDDIKNAKSEVEDVIQRIGFIYDSIRVILIQTDSPSFSEEVLEYAGKNWLEYSKEIGSYTYEWSSPIELIAEDNSGVYNFGSCYFG